MPIPASKELTEFLYISCRKKLTTAPPFWRPLCWRPEAQAPLPPYPLQLVVHTSYKQAAFTQKSYTVSLYVSIIYKNAQYCVITWKTYLQYIMTVQLET